MVLHLDNCIALFHLRDETCADHKQKVTPRIKHSYDLVKQCIQLSILAGVPRLCRVGICRWLHRQYFTYVPAEAFIKAGLQAPFLGLLTLFGVPWPSRCNARSNSMYNLNVLCISPSAGVQASGDLVEFFCSHSAQTSKQKQLLLLWATCLTSPHSAVEDEHTTQNISLSREYTKNKRKW